MIEEKSSGSIVDVMSAGICILAMSILMMSYLNSMELMNTKAEICQLARRYILRMETVGYLTASEKDSLQQELQILGVQNIDFTGTTMLEVPYGSGITLCIQGTLHGQETVTGEGLFGTVFQRREYDFRELRQSTAKQ